MEKDKERDKLLKMLERLGMGSTIEGGDILEGEEGITTEKTDVRKETGARMNIKRTGIEDRKEMSSVIEGSDEKNIIEDRAERLTEKKRSRRRRNKNKGVDKRSKILHSLYSTEEDRLRMNSSDNESSDRESVVEVKKSCSFEKYLK